MSPKPRGGHVVLQRRRAVLTQYVQCGVWARSRHVWRHHAHDPALQYLLRPRVLHRGRGVRCERRLRGFDLSVPRSESMPGFRGHLRGCVQAELRGRRRGFRCGSRLCPLELRYRLRRDLTSAPRPLTAPAYARAPRALVRDPTTSKQRPASLRLQLPARGVGHEQHVLVLGRCGGLEIACGDGEIGEAPLGWVVDLEVHRGADVARRMRMRTRVPPARSADEEVPQTPVETQR